MPTLRFRFCGQHGRRVQFRPRPDVPARVGWKAWSGTSETDTRRDRRRPPRSGRRTDVQPRTAAGEGAVRPPLSVSVVWSMRFRAGERMRLRRRLLPDLGGDVRVPAVRITRAVRCGRLPRLRRRIRTLERIGRIRVRLSALRDPCRVRCDPLFLRRLVRRLIPTSYQGREPSNNRFIIRLRRSFRRRAHPSKGPQPMMKPKRPRMSGRKTYYLVLWWMSQTPYAAIFENQVAAEAAANVANALMVRMSGREWKVAQVLDWYRRDESAAPMPAEWRDLVGQIHVPWLAKPKPAL